MFPVDSRDGTARQMRNKVPEVTLDFWVIKVLCTTVGEPAADNLNTKLKLGLTGHVSHWLHIDLPTRVAELGYPLMTVTPSHAPPKTEAALV